MRKYGSYTSEDLDFWERLPMPSKVLTESAFGAWLLRRDENRDKSLGLIKGSDLKAEIRHFMFEVNPSSSESDYACNYILDLIDKHIRMEGGAE